MCPILLCHCGFVAGAPAGWQGNGNANSFMLFLSAPALPVTFLKDMKRFTKFGSLIWLNPYLWYMEYYLVLVPPSTCTVWYVSHWQKGIHIYIQSLDFILTYSFCCRKLYGFIQKQAKSWNDSVFSFKKYSLFLSLLNILFSVNR